MRILYHHHARERMLKRGITEDEVRDVLTTFDTTLPADLDRTKYIKHIDKSESVTVVAVIRKISDTHFVVYTVFRERGNHG